MGSIIVLLLEWRSQRASPSNAVYRLCYRAYLHTKPIDVEKLRKVCSGATIEEINCEEPPCFFTPLSLIILNRAAQIPAISVLFEFGADPLISVVSRFHSSPVGLALKYERVDILPFLLRSLTAQMWEELVDLIMQPPDITGTGVGAGVWVKVDGKRAKIKVGGATKVQVQYADGEDPQSCSGPSQWLQLQELTVLPALPLASKEAFLMAAREGACPDAAIAKMKDLEDGHYGVEPRSLSAGSVLFFVMG